MKFYYCCRVLALEISFYCSLHSCEPWLSNCPHFCRSYLVRSRWCDRLASACRLSSVYTECIVAKPCVLEQSYYWQPTGSRIWEIDWYQNEWLWTIKWYVTDDVIAWPPKGLWRSTVGYPSDSLAFCFGCKWLETQEIHEVVCRVCRL